MQRQMVKLSGGIAAEKGKTPTIICIHDEGSFEEVVLSKGVHNSERLISTMGKVWTLEDRLAR